MGLVTVSNEVPQVKDRKRNKVRACTLNAHLEKVDGYYRILDLTRTDLEIPPVIASFCNITKDDAVKVVEKYMAKKRYTHYRVSYMTSKGMQFIN